MSLHPPPVFLGKGGISRIGKILEPGLSQDNGLVCQGLQPFQGFFEFPAADIALSGIGMHVVEAHFRDIFDRRLQPAGRIIGRSRIPVIDNRVGTSDVHLLFQDGILVHFVLESPDHFPPEFEVSVGGGPVSVRFVEDDEMLDAVEAPVRHQPVEVLDRSLHPFLGSFHIPGGWVVLSVNHHDIAALAVGQQFQEILSIPPVLEPFPREIGERAVDHAAHVLGLHVIQARIQGIPFRFGEGTPPGGRFIVGVPFYAVSQVIGINHLVGDRQFNPFITSRGQPGEAESREEKEGAGFHCTVMLAAGTYMRGRSWQKKVSERLYSVLKLSTETWPGKTEK